MAGLLTTVVDVNSTTLALTSNENKFIKFHSTARASMTGDGVALSYDFNSIENGSVSKRGIADEANGCIYNEFEDIESNVFKFSCDGADLVTYTETVEVDMIDYIKLTCNMNQSNISGDGKIALSCYGRFFNGSFGKVTNDLTVRCRCKAIGATSFTSWWDMNVTKDENVYYANLTIQNLNYEKNYIFEIEATDELETITAQRTVSSKPIFHWGKDDFTFEVPINAKDVRLKSSGSNYGHYLRFGDGDYCYIAELTDDVMTIKADDIILDTDNGKGSLSFGTWKPYLDSNAVQYWENCQKGWYSKVGNTVTVGFYIKAECYSGYTDTPIVIEGLPFTPSYDSAGGGMCSGAYVSGKYNFQCFVAETDGKITTRVQECNNTSAKNLGTSASGCNYSSGGGDVTLSGTITYLTNE